MCAGGWSRAHSVGDVSDTLPMFPLGTVLFPGVSVPLHVFEDRYRAMVHHLLRVPDPVDRVFGSVAIREGYEIGDHGNQSLYRVGCRIRMTEVESHPDGTFDLVGVGLDRIALDRLDTRGPYPVGHVTARPDATDPVPEDVVEQARVMFTAYRSALAQVRGDLLPAELPEDPTYLSWTLAALTPLPMPDRQSLLEAEDAGARLLLATDLLRAELRAMNVIPSLPATELARTRWSPN
jgi:Lon protease-like protein